MMIKNGIWRYVTFICPCHTYLKYLSHWTLCFSRGMAACSSLLLGPRGARAWWGSCVAPSDVESAQETELTKFFQRSAGVVSKDSWLVHCKNRWFPLNFPNKPIHWFLGLSPAKSADIVRDQTSPKSQSSWWLIGSLEKGRSWDARIEAHEK